MAIIFMDSFDHYATAQAGAKYTGGFNGNIGAIGRFGTNGYYRGGNEAAARPIGNIPVVIVGCAFQDTILPSGSGERAPAFTFFQGGEHQVSISMEAGGYLVARRGTISGTAIATSTTQFSGATWYYIEIKIKFHGSTGTLDMNVNGVADAGFAKTGLNTIVSANAWIDTVRLGGNQYGQVPGSLYYDDVYICDTNGPNNIFLGDIRVEYLVPNGSGVKTQFTPSTGSNWQTVDELSPSDADYNSASILGAMDLFGMTNMVGNGLVRGVQTILRGKKDDAGFRRVKPAFYKASGSGDTDRFYQGSQYPVGDSLDYGTPQVFNTSPDTGVAWTVDEVNALQYGYAVGDAGMFTLYAKLV